MTIVIGATRAAELATADQTNNPFFLWDNLITTYTAPSGTEAGGPIANLSSPATAKYVYPTTSGGGVYQIRFQCSGAISAVGLASHNLGTLQATVRIEYSDDGGSTWTDAGAGVVNATDDQAIIWRFDEQTHADWRISMYSLGVAGQPALAVLYAGAEMIMPLRMFQGYASPLRPNNVRVQSNVSEGGHFMGVAVTKAGSSIDIPFDLVKNTFVRSATFLGFITHYNETRPFFWAWRPTAYSDAFLCWRAGDTLQPVNTGPTDRTSFSLQVRAYDDP